MSKYIPNKKTAKRKNKKCFICLTPENFFYKVKYFLQEIKYF